MKDAFKWQGTGVPASCQSCCVPFRREEASILRREVDRLDARFPFHRLDGRDFGAFRIARLVRILLLIGLRLVVRHEGRMLDGGFHGRTRQAGRVRLSILASERMSWLVELVEAASRPSGGAGDSLLLKAKQATPAPALDKHNCLSYSLTVSAAILLHKVSSVQKSAGTFKLNGSFWESSTNTRSASSQVIL